jgi:hypothetical protein
VVVVGGAAANNVGVATSDGAARMYMAYRGFIRTEIKRLIVRSRVGGSGAKNVMSYVLVFCFLVLIF